ncbi:MAG: hypothetical protein DRG40_01300, partial [Deltaproteobacteria bacterium]
MRLQRILPFLVVAFFGCATTEDISYLHHRINKLEERVAKTDRRVSETVTEAQKEVGSEVQKVRTDLASLDADIRALKEQVRTLQASLEENWELLRKLSMRLEELEQKKVAKEEKPEETPPPSAVLPPPTAPALAPIPSPPAPEGEKEEYQQAYETFRSGDYSRAMALFQDFLKKYPKSKLADNAQYWIGECYYMRGEYEKAIL